MSSSREFKINAVDVIITVIIAAVIAVCAIVIAGAFGVDASAKTELTVEYSIQFRGIRPELSDNAAVGDEVVEASKRLSLGTVSKVKSEPYTVDVFDSTSEQMVAAEYPDLITLSVTLTSNGYVSDEMYYVNGVKIAVGSPISIHAKNFAGTGYITEMNIIEQSEG